TGETKFLARLPEAIDWLEKVALPSPTDRGQTHPTFIELATDRPLYVHRRGSNVVNGEYYTDYDSRKTLGHYSAFRRIDTASLREQYEDARATSPESIARASPLLPGEGAAELPRVFMDAESSEEAGDLDARAIQAIEKLNSSGWWPAPLP